MQGQPGHDVGYGTWPACANGSIACASRPLLDQQGTHAYVPPITAELHGGSSQGTGNGFGLSPAGGPCERAYHRALTKSHPSWRDRYED